MKKLMFVFAVSIPLLAYEPVTISNRHLWVADGNVTEVAMRGAKAWEERTNNNEIFNFIWHQSSGGFVYLFDFSRNMWLAMSDRQAFVRIGSEGAMTPIYNGTWRSRFGFRLHIDEKFTQRQMELLVDATQMVADRFTTASIAECTRKNTERVLIRDDYQIRKGWEARLAGWGDLRRTVTSQTRVLEQYRFPDLTIRAYEEQERNSGSIGYAYNSDGISVPFDASSPEDIQGNFKIYINDRVIGGTAGPLDNDNTYWASVIAHEMLHNMGHMHPKGDYATDLQIVAFDNCIFKNGQFDRTIHRRYEMSCGRK